MHNYGVSVAKTAIQKSATRRPVHQAKYKAMPPGSMSSWFSAHNVRTSVATKSTQIPCAQPDKGKGNGQHTMTSPKPAVPLALCIRYGFLQAHTLKVVIAVE